jgi:hypothetical protein
MASQMMNVEIVISGRSSFALRQSGGSSIEMTAETTVTRTERTIPAIEMGTGFHGPVFGTPGLEFPGGEKY